MAHLAIMPRLSLNEQTNLLTNWYVAEGDRVHVGDKLFSIETDKSAMDVDSAFEGVVLKRYYDEYAVVGVLMPVCAIGEAGEEIPTPEPEPSAEEVPAATKVCAPASPARPTATTPVAIRVDGEVPFASPRAKRLAMQRGITSFGGIVPSGAQGRVLEEDILRFVASGAKPPKTMADCQVVKFSNIRRVIAKNMLESLQTSAQLTLTAVFNAAAIQATRAKFKQDGGAYKAVTIGDLIVYGTAKTLVDFPNVNAWVGDGQVTRFEMVNVGVAVDTERGLMVPTILNASEKTLLDVSQETKVLAAACQAGNLAPEKMQAATFTISNLGSFGVRSFTPVLNPPQAAILGVGTIDYAGKVGQDGILLYPACHLSLTFDHRALDGAPAARFLKALCENLERIDRLL